MRGSVCVDVCVGVMGEGTRRRELCLQCPGGWLHVAGLAGIVWEYRGRLFVEQEEAWRSRVRSLFFRASI